MSHDKPKSNPPELSGSNMPHRGPAPDAQGHSVDQLLIAYLDGELDDPAAAELESRLADDAGLRNRLHEFQKTWDMLDEVTRNTANDKFIKSTIEMVVTSAGKKRARWHRWPIRIVAGIIAFAIPALLAFQLVRYVQNQPSREFIADLDFWENVDMYDKVDNIDFVEQMNSAGLFVEEIDDAP